MQIILCTILLGVSLYDLRMRKVPNLLTYPLLLGALALHVYQGQSLSGFLGAGMGLVWLLVPYLCGWVGAGDVKLLAAVGAFVGWPLALNLSLLSGALGGPLVILVALTPQDLRPLWISLARGPLALCRETAAIIRSRSKKRVPYAFSIFLGFSVLCLLGRP